MYAAKVRKLLIGISIILIILNITSNLCLANFRFSPVKFFLEENFKVTSMEVYNESEKSRFFHAIIFKWKQIEGKDSYEATSDIFITPAIFEIKPNERQIIRLAQDRDKISSTDNKEKAYRLFLKEIPRQDKNEPAINFSFHFSFPLFIKPKNFLPLDDETLRDKLPIVRNDKEISLTNNLNTSIHIIDAVIEAKNNSNTTQTIHSYLLPGEKLKIKYNITDNNILAFNIQQYGNEYTIPLSDSS